MRCQNCQVENPDNYIYCYCCGAVIIRPRRIDDRLIRVPREGVIRAIAERRRADTIVPLSLVWILFVGNVGLLVAQFAFFFFLVHYSSNFQTYFYSWSDELSSWLVVSYAMTLGGYILAVLSYYVYYKLVTRQNNHYARERELRTSVISLIQAAADTPERRQLVDGDLMVMGMAHSVTEPRRRPWFWVLVAAIPQIMSVAILVTFWVVGSPSNVSSGFFWLLLTIPVTITALVLQLYMFWFLSDTMLNHDSRWRSFSVVARNALSKLGFPQGKRLYVRSLPDRPLAAYVVLTVFTGLFIYYWLYALVKDPNEHFRDQWRFEDDLMRDLRVTRYPASDGALGP